MLDPPTSAIPNPVSDCLLVAKTTSPAELPPINSFLQPAGKDTQSDDVSPTPPPLSSQHPLYLSLLQPCRTTTTFLLSGASSPSDSILLLPANVDRQAGLQLLVSVQEEREADQEDDHKEGRRE